MSEHFATLALYPAYSLQTKREAYDSEEPGIVLVIKLPPTSYSIDCHRLSESDS